MLQVCNFGDAKTLPDGNVFNPQVLQSVDATDDSESTGQPVDLLNMDFFAAAPMAPKVPPQVDPIASALVNAPTPAPPTTQEPVFDFSGAQAFDSTAHAHNDFFAVAPASPPTSVANSEEAMPTLTEVASDGVPIMTPRTSSEPSDPFKDLLANSGLSDTPCHC